MTTRDSSPVSWPWLASATLLVLGLASLVWFAGRIAGIILLFFGAVIVAVILDSAAALICRWTPLSRRWALPAAGLLIVAIVGALGYLLGARIAGELASLSQQLPAAVASFSDRMGIADPWRQLQQLGGDGWLLGFLGYVPTVVEAVSTLILVVFGGIFLAIHPKMYVEGALQLVPPGQRGRLRSAAETAGRALRLWLLGKLVAMLVIGGAVTAGLWLVGVPSPIALGLIAGLLEFVSYVGPIVAFVPAGLVALTQGLSTFWLVLGLFVVVQLFESNLLGPLITERAVQLPPVLALFAVLAMGAAFGPLGIVTGVPLAVVGFVAVKQLYVRDTLHEEVQLPGKDAG